MKQSQTITAALLISALFLVGCNQNSKSGVTPTNQERQLVTTVNSSLFPIYGGYSVAHGKIYTDPQYQAEFNQVIKWIIAAYIDPAQVGDVNTTTGVAFRAYVEVGNNNGVNSQTSGFEMIINDSFALAGKNENGEKIEPLKLGAQAVAMNLLTNTAKVTFANENGIYVFEGQFDQSNFTGIVKFQNRTSWNPQAEIVHDGENQLGGFSIPTCSFFRCQ